MTVSSSSEAAVFAEPAAQARFSRHAIVSTAAAAVCPLLVALGAGFIFLAISTSGLRTAGLLLGGAFGFTLPMFAAIAAIVNGHRARMDKEAGGRGLALAGLIAGYAEVAVLTIVPCTLGLVMLWFGTGQA